VTAALVRWAGLSLCYLAFAGTLSRAEGIAAALTGAFAAFLSIGLRTQGERRLSLRGAWTGELARTSRLLARDTWRVGSTLVRAILRGHRGQMARDREAAVRPLGSGAGHRAVTALLASVTPDSMAIEPDDEAIPVHRLSRSRPARRRPRTR
jgi:hypothetical protein